MIQEFRTEVYDKLVAGLPAKAPVHRFIPDDLGTTPAVVVGRPTVNVSDQLPGAWDFDLTVYILGNRVSSRTAQDDLDVRAWAVVGILDIGDIKTNNITQARVASVTPALTPVAGVEYPCYMVSLVGTSTICR